MKYIIMVLFFCVCVNVDAQDTTKSNNCDSIFIASLDILYPANWWAHDRDSSLVSYKEWPSIGYFCPIDQKAVLGTGFLLNGGFVVTCYHVALILRNYGGPISIVVPGQSCGGSMVDLIDSIPSQDIAIYKMNRCVYLKGLEIGNFDDIQLLDTLDYAGSCRYKYDTVFHGHSVVIQKGESIDIQKDPINNKNKSFGFLVGLGHSWRGLSGSPLLNKKGEAIAILSGSARMEKFQDSGIVRSLYLTANSLNSVGDLIKKLKEDASKK
jgi:hypothetical protein